MNYVSVCSGIEAFSVAVAPLGWTPKAFAEIEKFPSALLAHRFPSVPNLGDFTRIKTKTLGPVGWLAGGTPCQAFSVAGLRQGLKDDRGNLTLEFVRLAHALVKNNGLRGFLWENVPGVLSDKSNAFGCFLGGIVGADGPLVTPDGKRWPNVGMVAGPRARLAWRVLNSQHFGVPQRRKRVFVVADFGGGPDPAAVLFEPGGQKRSAAARRKAWQELAGTLGGSSQSGGHRTTDLDNNGAFVVTAPTLRAGGNETGGHRPPGSDVDTVETLVITHALKAEGADGSEDGTGRGVPMVVAEYLGNAEGGNGDIPGLTPSNTGKTVNNQTPLVAVYDPNQVTSPDNRSKPTPELAHALPSDANAPVLYSITPSNSNEDYNARANGHTQAITGNAGSPPSARGGDLVVTAFNPKASGKQTSLGADDQNSPTLSTTREVAVAFNLRGREGGNMPELGDDQASALRSGDGGSSKPMVLSSGVRRLMPIECERLQGFPDNWTLVPGYSGWRPVGDDEDRDELLALGFQVRVSKKTGKASVNDPDGPRYKSLGNSFTTEPVNWIMSRVEASMAGLPMPDWQPMRLWMRQAVRAS